MIRLVLAFSGHKVDRIVWTKAALALSCLAASASGASAIDLVLKSQVGQSVEFNDNRDLAPKSKGDTYSFLSTLMFDAVARTPTTKFAATVDLSYRSFAGPGAGELIDAPNGGIRASMESKQKLTTYKLAGSYARRDASTVQIEDIGFATVNGHVDTYVAEGGLRRELSPQESIGWMTRLTSIRFSSQSTSSPAPDSLDVTTTADWTRQIDVLTSVNGSLQFEYQSLDNASGTTNLIWRPFAGFQSRLTKQLTIKGTAGISIVTTTQDNPRPIPPATTPLPSGTKLGWLADLLLVYKMKMQEISFFVGHNVAPSALGDLQERSTVSLSVRQDINPISAIAVAATYSHVTAPPGSNSILIDQTTVTGNAVDVYTAGIDYSYKLARDWNAGLSYKFSHRRSDTTSANSNAVVLSVKHDMTLWHDDR
jgi:hypothetical protein